MVHLEEVLRPPPSPAKSHSPLLGGRTRSCGLTPLGRLDVRQAASLSSKHSDRGLVDSHSIHTGVRVCALQGPVEVPPSGGSRNLEVKARSCILSESSGQRGEEAQAVPGVKPRNLRLRWLPPDEPPHFLLQVCRGQTAQEDRPCLWSPSVTPPTVIMPLFQRSELRETEADLQDQVQAQGPEEVQLLGAVGEGATSPSTASPPVASSSAARADALLEEALNMMVADLVWFLLRKYRAKEPTSKAEILNMVLKDHQDHFPVVLGQASECMQLVFGMDVKEVDPREHTYVLVPTLGLTCNVMLSDGQSFPKAGLLVMLLGVIALEGERASEQKVWRALRKMGVRPLREHRIYGEPRELLTRVWVQEGYVEYRQVPHSNPARYEFLWGPRAHAEINRLQVREYLHRANRWDPRSFLSLCAEPVSDEEEGA
ncbi:melanoma-associated antigen 9-like [Hippopotamus amphibius kiboko]|uniref:melanoma-associated antigen 9-like n=1 Tax=Hippopotamus amphibius kiboko TaxID=575201 RepID=UPI0025914A13|nr:melanoma-associated antigen 9-like [Hippopotamus amphibius kiboko]